MKNKLLKTIEQSILCSSRCQWVGALVTVASSLYGANKQAEGAQLNAEATSRANITSNEQWGKEFGLQKQKHNLDVEKFGYQKKLDNNALASQETKRVVDMFNSLPMKNNMIRIFSGKV
jgi:hypothetical protein